MNAANLLPVGTRVLVTLHSISTVETVPGTVVDHGRRSNIIATACHGRVVVNTDQLVVIEDLDTAHAEQEARR